MRRGAPRAIAVAAVLGAALIAHAVGNGDIVATPEVAVTTVTSPTGSATGSTTLQNTTSSTTFNVLLGSDATCDPALSFAVAGGNPITSFAPMSSRTVQLGCPARGSAAMRRCLVHATNSATTTALADFLSVCLYGATPGTLVPSVSTLDFGTVTVGEAHAMALSLQHGGASGTIRRVYLQSSDLDGNFRFSTPCNPDTASCDAELVAPVAPGGALPLQIRCAPQTPGMHTAQLFVGTDTFQLLSTGVTLQCMGTAAAGPVLGVTPTSITVQQIVEVGGGSANTIVRLANTGAGTLLIRDVRTVDVDTGAASDWSYSASGACTGTITSACSLDVGERVDLAVKFAPSAIGRRRATLLVSYRDTIDRTSEIPLDGTGHGATLGVVGIGTTLAFGQVPIGRTSELVVQVANGGNRVADTTTTVEGGASPPFSVDPMTAAIAPTESTPVTIACAPTATGVTTTTISIAEEGSGATLPVTISASCEGTSFSLYADPTSVIFDELRVGASPAVRTVQLLSTGAPLTLSGQPQLEGTLANVTLGPLSSMTTPASFTITIDPAADSQIANAIIVPASNGEILRIPFAAKVATATYEVAPVLDLGTFCVNQPTTPSTLPLLSDGTAPITVQQPTLAQSPSPFQLAFTSPPLYPTRLAPGTAAKVAITPARQTQVMTVSDIVTWQTDVAGALSATTTINARYIDSGGAIAPPALDFGEVTAHLFVDDGQRVIIQNCNDTPLELDQPMIRTPFSIDSPNFPTMLAPNESVTFSVGFHPTRVGPVSETLRITSPQLPGEPLEVMLFGEGVATEEAPDAGVGSSGLSSTSFYACACSSSGRPLGVLPILIAVVCVLVPRRRRA